MSEDQNYSSILAVHPSTTCFWWPVLEEYPDTPENRQAFIDGNAVEVSANDDRFILALLSQLKVVRALATEDGAVSYWTHRQSLEDVQKAPIILACGYKDYQQIKDDSNIKGDDKSPIQIKLNRSIPPHDWGLIGGVIDNAIGTFYSVKKLGTDGVRLHEQIVEALQLMDVNSTQVQEISIMGGNLAALYWQHHQREKPGPTISLIPNVMDENNHIEVPTTQVIQDVLMGLVKGKWEKSADGLGLPFKAMKHYDLMVLPTEEEFLIRPDIVETIPPNMYGIQSDELWNISKRFGVEHIDVMMIWLAHACVVISENGRRRAVISIARIMQYRNILRRYDSDKDTRHGLEQTPKERIRQICEDILHVSIRAHIGKRTTFVRLFDVSRRSTGDRQDQFWTPNVQADWNRVEEWNYDIGEWLIIPDDLSRKQTGRLASTIFSYHPHNQEWEKLIGYYMLFRFRLSYGAPETMRIDKLMEEVGLTNRISSRYFSAAKKRLKKALDTLATEERDVNGTYIIRPRIIDGWEPLTPWEECDSLATWLTKEIRIRCPSYVIDQYNIPRQRNAEYQEKKEQRKALAKETMDRKEQRKRKGSHKQ
jgi:hypothetical protein